MKEWYRKPELIWTLVALVLAGGIWLAKSSSRPAGQVINLKTDENQSAMSADNLAEGEIVVHVAGAVKQPGVYRLGINSRLIDALQAAGGVLSCADLEALNLAQVVQDGQKVMVKEKSFSPLAGPPSGMRNVSAGLSGSSPGLGERSVNINSATLDQLQTLPGIGPKLAQNIFQYRESHGPFAKWENLRNVQGIGEKRLAKIKEAAVL